MLQKMRLCLVILAVGLLSPAYGQEVPLSGDALLAQAKAEINNIDTAQLKAILKKAPDTLLVDVRTNREIYAMGGTIRSGKNVVIPRGWLELRIGEWALKKDTPIIVYCGTNQRSPLAAKTLMKMGYSNVKNYADGAIKWLKANQPTDAYDLAKDSFLYRKPQKVMDRVYSAIGATQPYTVDNVYHNNNLSFIITDGGVLVFNAGGNYLLAQAFHDEIKKITDKPVKYVVLENAQGHAALGASYWKDQGIPIIAHQRTAKKMAGTYGKRSMARMKRILGDKSYKSRIVAPDQTFSDKLDLVMGSEKIQLIHFGEAHERDDVALWMPSRKLLIAGDYAFHERLLPVMKDTNVKSWLESWKKMEALGAAHIIPGHGHPVTDMKDIGKYTAGYLRYLRSSLQKVLDDGGSMTDAYKIDMREYSHLDTFQQLSAQNIARMYQKMEFE